MAFHSEQKYIQSKLHGDVHVSSRTQYDLFQLEMFMYRQLLLDWLHVQYETPCTFFFSSLISLIGYSTIKRPSSNTRSVVLKYNRMSYCVRFDLLIGHMSMPKRVLLGQHQRMP